MSQPRGHTNFMAPVSYAAGDKVFYVTQHYWQVSRYLRLEEWLPVPFRRWLHDITSQELRDEVGIKFGKIRRAPKPSSCGRAAGNERVRPLETSNIDEDGKESLETAKDSKQD